MHLNAAENPHSDGLSTARITTRAKAAEPSKWKQSKQKQLRMEGKSYASKRKKDGETVSKQPRAMGPRCSSDTCKKASNRLCAEITEEARKRAFDEFWQHMNWAQRKLYVAGQVNRDPVGRSRAAGLQSRRSASLRYHLLVDGKRKQVCKNMFLSTLGIGEWSVLHWAQRAAANKAESGESNPEKRSAVPQRPLLVPAPPARSNATLATQGEWGFHLLFRYFLNLVTALRCISVTFPVVAGHLSTTDTKKPADSEAPGRKKSRVAKPLTWKQNRQKQLRMEGKPYISKRKKDGVTVTKSQRSMGPRCTSSACKRASNRFCADFSEEARRELFTSFWQCMNWAQRKVHVAGLVDCDPVERTRAPWTQSRRSVSMRYHLIAGGDRKQVCKKMFLSTLGVGEWSVLHWAQNAPQPDGSEESATKRMQRKSRKASEHVVLKEFLESLPKVSSCCCGTSKLYLEPVFSNMSEVYRHYYSHCSATTAAPLSRQVFCAVFKKMNLGLCDPKKDQRFSLGATGSLFHELWEEYCVDRGAPGQQAERGGGQQRC